LRQGKELAEVDKQASAAIATRVKGQASKTRQVRKLSYNEQRELEQLPGTIETLESRVAKLQEQIAASDFYAQDHKLTAPVFADLTETQHRLDLAVERWTTLEDQAQAYKDGRIRS